MKTDDWDQEFAEYLGSSSAARVRWLAHLAFALTVCARNTYEVQTDDLVDPQSMRRFNELQHRVIGELRSELDGVGGRSLDLFLLLVREATRELRLSFSGLKQMMGNY